MNNSIKNLKIKVENLKKNYGTIRALKGVSLEVHTGEVLVIIGPSGCGKSTFLRCMNLLEEPTEGILQIGNHIINFADKKTIPTGKNIARFRSQFGMVFQQFDLFLHKTAIENIMIGLTVVKKIPYDDAKNIAIINTWDIGTKFDKVLTEFKSKTYTDIDRSEIKETFNLNVTNIKHSSKEILRCKKNKIDFNW